MINLEVTGHRIMPDGREVFVVERDELEKHFKGMAEKIADLQTIIAALPAIVSDMDNLDEGGPCNYADGGGSDCGNWDTCRAECPRRRLRELAGYEPRQDGQLGKPKAAEAAGGEGGIK